ncbi:MAG: hypothetical protein DME57_11310, partial [Verrucomicrobia bacterium]
MRKARAISRQKSRTMQMFINVASRCAIRVCEMRNKISDRWIVAGVCAGLIEYLSEVPEINNGLSWHNLKWAFTHWPSTNWFPLTNISHMVDFQIYGSNPGAFHLTNVVLHSVAALSLFLVLLLMTKAIWRCAFVAAVFAIHPLRVESVAWVIERKDVLSGLFFVLTLGAYLYYTRKPSIARYVAMSILFAAGMLSKAMLVTTPVILLLVDYWPLGRMTDFRKSWPLIREKLPLFVIAVVIAFFNTRGIAPAHSAADQLPFLARFGNALVGYLVYIWQTIWPADLAVFYPFPANGLPIWQPIAAAAILLALTIAIIAVRKSRPYLFVGWFWYLIMLAPVIGIVQVNLQAHADRYTYLPQIGL